MSEDSAPQTQKEQVEDFDVDVDSWDDVEVPEDLEASSEEEVAEEEPDNSDIEEYMDEEDESDSVEEEEDSEAEDKEEPSKEEEKPEPEKEEEPKEELHEVTQNGEKLEVTLQELKNGYSGTKEITKRLGELDKEKKEFYAEKSLVEAYIAGFAEKVKDGNILGGLGYFGEFAQLPSHLLKEQLITALLPEIEARSVMTPEELRNHKLRAENNYLAQKNESDTKLSTERQAKEAELSAKKELDSTINGLKETHNITEQEWDLAFTELDKSLPPGDIITPEMVVDKATSVRAENQSTQKVQRVIRDYENEINDEFVAELKKVALEYPTLSDDELKTVIEDSIKLHREQQLKASLEKKAGKKQSPKSSKETQEEEDEFDLSEYIDEDGW